MENAEVSNVDARTENDNCVRLKNAFRTFFRPLGTERPSDLPRNVDVELCSRHFF